VTDDSVRFVQFLLKVTNEPETLIELLPLSKLGPPIPSDEQKLPNPVLIVEIDRVLSPETLPVGPVIPVGPATPCTPCNPIGPTSPFGPIGPAGPTKPIGPTAPTSPLGPCGPGPPSDDARSDDVHLVAARIAPVFLLMHTLIISPAGIVGAVVVGVVVSSALALPKPNDPIIIPIERMEIVCRFARVVVFMPLT